MFLALVLAAVLSPSTAATPLANAVVPVDTQSAVTTSAGTYLDQTATATGDGQNVTPAAQPMGSPAPNPTLPQTGVGWLFTKMGSSVTSELGPIMNMSIATAQVIFRYIAAVSLIINLLSLMGTGQDLSTVIITAFRKIVEWSFLLLIITCTWSTPGGGPGWFPAIVGGIINIGIQIAQMIAPPGTPLPAQIDGTLNNLAAYPGTVADLGARLYTNINASAPPDGFWAAIPVLGVPSAIVSGAIHVLYWFAAVYAYANCLYVAIRYFMMVVKTFMVGFLQFLQGLTASNRLSSFGSGLYTAPIIVGSEFCIGTILVGIALLLVEQLSYSYRLCSSLGVDPSGAGCGLLAASLPADQLASIGDLVELGMVLTAWTYAMRTVPTLVADAIAGRISVSMAEVQQHFSASPFVGARAIGGGMGVISSTAEGGALAGAKTAFAPVGNLLRNSGMGAIAGTAGGALKGAVGGFLLGGPEGAVAGAVTGAVTSAMKGGGKDEKSSEESSSASPAANSEESGDTAEQHADEAQMESDDRAAQASENGGGTVTGGAPISTSTTATGAPSAANTVQGAQQARHAAQDASGSSDSTKTATQTTNVKQQVNKGDAGGTTTASTIGDSAKTATQTTNVKQNTTSQSPDDVVKALQGLSAALNANTAAVKSGSGSAGAAKSSASSSGESGAESGDTSSGSSSSSGGRSAGGHGTKGNGLAAQLGLDMSIGGMIAREALYRKARTPAPPPPPPHEQSASIGGIMTGIR